MGTIIALLGALLLGLLAFVGVFLAGMRAKWPPVMDRVRRMNMRYLNPRQMEDAGQAGAFAEVLRHVGRKSGKTHETPLTARPTEDGFVIGLVYGERTQWLRNVLAAGSAEVIRKGVTYPVDRPEVVPIADVARYFSKADQRVSGLFGVEQALRLYHWEHD